MTNTNTQPPLSFTVRCSACYGAETWTLGRISRALTTIGKLPPESTSDIEFIAEQFTANSKHILCPNCDKKGVLKVRRVVAEI